MDGEAVCHEADLSGQCSHILSQGAWGQRGGKTVPGSSGLAASAAAGSASFSEAQDVDWETREKLAALFNFPAPENVVFSMNVTQSLNFLLKGLLKPDDHVIVSSLEHNAVMRPSCSWNSREWNSPGFSAMPRDALPLPSSRSRSSPTRKWW